MEETIIGIRLEFNEKDCNSFDELIDFVKEKIDEEIEDNYCNETREEYIEEIFEKRGNIIEFICDLGYSRFKQDCIDSAEYIVELTEKLKKEKN